MNGSNWTGRTARSLSDAFGPHSYEAIENAEPEWYDKPAALILAASAAVFVCWGVVLIAFALWGTQ